MIHYKRILKIFLVLCVVGIFVIQTIKSQNKPKISSIISRGKISKYYVDKGNEFGLYYRTEKSAEGTQEEEVDLSSMKLRQEIKSYWENKKEEESVQGPVLEQSKEEVLRTEAEYKKEIKNFFKGLMELIKFCQAQTNGINDDAHYHDSKMENKQSNREGRIPLYGGHLRENYLEEPIRTKKMLSYYLRLSKKEIHEIQITQDQFCRDMPRSFPENILKFHRNMPDLDGDGIVYLGGGKYNQLVLLSLKILRDSGSKLPVEVILPSDGDYSQDFCENVLPKYNGKCKIMTDYIPPEIISLLVSYQFKSISMLVSSFKRILYLDADNIPIGNVDDYFANPPFTTTGLVIWPDLWRRSTSPLFYEVSRIRVDESKKVRESYFGKDSRKGSSQKSYHDCKGAIPEASSETGQILLDKDIHFSTIILSMFYNYYGPDYYYALLSQGAAGEGDKETFIAAAHKLNLPYYQVQEFNKEFGPLDASTNKLHLFGMGQFNPIVDYVQYSNPKICLSKGPEAFARSSADISKSNYDFTYFKYSKLSFLHANWPKFYLWEMFMQNGLGRGPVVDDQRRRLYGSELIETLGGHDLELQIFKAIHELYCGPNKINLNDIPDTDDDDRLKICSEVDKQIKFLETTALSSH